MSGSFRPLIKCRSIVQPEGSNPITTFMRKAHRKTAEVIDKLKFSETRAYFGNDRVTQPISSGFQFDYFQTFKFKKARLQIWLSSVAALFIYFKYLREPSDVDTLFEVPPHVLTAECERKMIQQKINDARKRGKSTALLEEELEYVNVKEEVIMKQLEE